jgi:hypothetical protein
LQADCHHHVHDKVLVRVRITGKHGIHIFLECLLVQNGREYLD